MDEQEMHMESERLLEEARLEIEAIKQVLEANRQIPDAGAKAVPALSHDKSDQRTN